MISSREFARGKGGGGCRDFNKHEEKQMCEGDFQKHFCMSAYRYLDISSSHSYGVLSLRLCKNRLEG